MKIRWHQIPTTNRLGVSLVEVLFAMMIALFGLAGVLAIIPLAARQASDSYALNQATSGAMNALAVSAAADLVLPSDKSPWVYDDDLVSSPGTTSADPYDPPLANTYTNVAGVHPYKPVRTMDAMYTGLRTKRLNDPNMMAFSPTATWRRVIGQGFCFDPLYSSYVNQTNWLSRGKTWTTDYANSLIRRNRMPFFNDQAVMNPTTGNWQVGAIETPRLIRVSSLARTNLSSVNLPLPLSTVAADAQNANIGDLIQATIQQDKSFGALREFDGANASSLISSAKKADLSWFATVVPIESKNLEFPRQFMVSVVVVNKRDRTFEIPDSNTFDVLPEGERFALATQQTDYTQPPISAGTLLNATLHFDARSEARLRAGDYVMLSRYVQWNLADSLTNGRRLVHRHAWYRVVAVGEASDAAPGTPQISRDVVLQGRPWDYPDLNPALNGPGPLPTGAGLPTGITLPVNTEIATVATVVEGVVAVYEYPIAVK